MEVTKGEFETFTKETGYVSTSSGCYLIGDDTRVSTQHGWFDTNFTQANDHPVVCVTWEDATAFALWIDEIVGDKWNCSLPTEAQEKAAKEQDEVNQSAMRDGIPKVIFGMAPILQLNRPRCQSCPYRHLKVALLALKTRQWRYWCKYIWGIRY